MLPLIQLCDNKKGCFESVVGLQPETNLTLWLNSRKSMTVTGSSLSVCFLSVACAFVCLSVCLSVCVSVCLSVNQRSRYQLNPKTRSLDFLLDSFEQRMACSLLSDQFTFESVYSKSIH